MNPPTLLNARLLSTTLLIGGVISVSACGGTESSDAGANPPSGTAGALASPDAGAIAPPGTGFIMVSGRGQLHLNEPSYLEQSDCMLRVSALRDAKEYERCMEVPRTAVCLQVTVGYREVDRWWECFIEPVVCEDRTAEHDVLWQLVKDARAILQSCAERELASMFGI